PRPARRSPGPLGHLSCGPRDRSPVWGRVRRHERSLEEPLVRVAVDARDVQVARNRGDEPRVVGRARNVADRLAEAQAGGKVEAVDVAEKIRTRAVARQELEPGAEIRVAPAGGALLARRRTEAVAPERDRVVNARELGLRREADLIAGPCDRVSG